MGLVFPAFDLSFFILVVTVMVAGVARGMSGFGSGMIIAPVAAALYGPQVAVPMLALLDSFPTIPVTIPALRLARWREVLPVTVGLLVFLPIGVYLLAHGNENALRWTICASILVCAAVLWSGWRYRGPRSLPISFGVGGVSGVLSGVASVPGPPVIFYWMASDLPAILVRANLMSLFLISDLLSIANYWVARLFTGEVIGLALAATPPYFVALLIGSRFAGLASEATYRRVTFVLIVISAVLAVPLAQPAMRWLGEIFW